VVRAHVILCPLIVLAPLDVLNDVHGVCKIMDGMAGVSAKPSRAQDMSLSHQRSQCCGVSCASRRDAKWLGEKRGLSEFSHSSFFSVCSRWNDEGRGLLLLLLERESGWGRVNLHKQAPSAKREG
jgi:hypothetical protein